MKLYVLEYRCNNLIEESCIISVFSNLENIQVWLNKNAKGYDKMTNNHWYWFVAYDVYLDNGEAFDNNFWFFDNNGKPIIEQHKLNELVQ